MTGAVMVGDKELHFRFDVKSWLEIEDEFGSYMAMLGKMGGNAKPMHALLHASVILANGYSRTHPEQARVTFDELAEKVTPGQSGELTTAVHLAMRAGFNRKIATADDTQEDYDEILREINKNEKKKKPGKRSEQLTASPVV